MLRGAGTQEMKEEIEETVLSHFEGKKTEIKILLFSIKTWWKDMKITEHRATLISEQGQEAEVVTQEIQIWFKEKMLPCSTDWQNNLWVLYCWRLKVFKLIWTIPCATWTSWTYSEEGFSQNDLNRFISAHTVLWFGKSMIGLIP